MERRPSGQGPEMTGSRLKPGTSFLGKTDQRNALALLIRCVTSPFVERRHREGYIYGKEHPLTLLPYT